MKASSYNIKTGYNVIITSQIEMKIAVKMSSRKRLYTASLKLKKNKKNKLKVVEIAEKNGKG